MLSSEVLSSDGFILVYDTSSLSSFSRASELGIQLRSASSHDIPLILAGNKCDLVRKVSFEKGKKLAGELGCEFMETSAKSDINVADVFANVTRTLRMTEVNVQTTVPEDGLLSFLSFYFSCFFFVHVD